MDTPEGLAAGDAVQGFQAQGVLAEGERALVAEAALAEAGQIRGCIFGENWSKSDETTWRLLQAHAELKSDPDLGRRNQGITVVLL